MRHKLAPCGSAGTVTRKNAKRRRCDTCISRNRISPPPSLTSRDSSALVDGRLPTYLAPSLSNWSAHLDVPVYVAQIDATELRTGAASTQMSMRSSMDYVGGVRARLPGDRTHISDWAPPQQSMFASQLMEVDQLKALQTYVSNVEDELQKHNELRGLMLLAFTTKHLNSTKAMHNWEKKSSYLLREIVKFRTYIDALQNAQSTKERIYKMRKEEDDAHRAKIDSRVLNAQGGAT